MKTFKTLKDFGVFLNPIIFDEDDFSIFICSWVNCIPLLAFDGDVPVIPKVEVDFDLVCIDGIIFHLEIVIASLGNKYISLVPV